MHQEYSKKKKVSIMEIVVMASILFFVILGVNIFIYSKQLASIYGDVVTIAMPIIIVIYLMKGYNCTYEYTIICEEFIMKKIKGRSEEILVDINVNQIKTLRKGSLPLGERKQFSTIKNICKNSKREDCYYCVYEEDGDQHYFEFQVSEKMIMKMQQQ